MFGVPNDYINFMTFLSLIVVGIIFVFSQVRRSDLKVLRDANTDLRDSIKDKDLKLVQMNTELMDLRARVVILEGKISDQANLIKEALIAYFEKNPSAAKKE